VSKLFTNWTCWKNYSLLPDVAYDLSDGSLDGDFHLTASAAGAAIALPGTALEITNDSNHLLQPQTSVTNENVESVHTEYIYTPWAIKNVPLYF